MKISQIFHTLGIVFLFFFSISIIQAEAAPLVKVEGRQLLVDFDQNGTYDPYIIKGAGYNPMPVGRHVSDWGYPDAGDPRPDNIFDDPDILDRDFALLQAMNANTIRIWKGDDTQDGARFPNKLTQLTLDKAEANNIKVIAGFWIGPEGYYECVGTTLNYTRQIDFEDPAVRSDILTRFGDYVTDFKDHPAILFWAIGNENNLHFGTDIAKIQAYYSLVQEMGQLVQTIEGADAHPVALINGDMGTIGDANVGASDAQLSSIQIWGSNIYRGESFGSLFNDYQALSNKPLWISEFGADAWHTNDINDPDNGYENQIKQSEYQVKLWDEIFNNKEITIGGTMMAYSDEWWKPNEWLCETDGDPNTNAALCNSTQNHYGFGPKDTDCDGSPDFFPALPDQYFNDEWWGIVSIAVNPTLYEADLVTPRLVYTTLQNKFALGAANLLEFNRTTNSVRHNWVTVNLLQAFPSAPIVLSGMETYDGGDTANTRIQQLSASSFQVKIEEEQSKNSETNHTTEVVGYIALAGDILYDRDGDIIGESGQLNHTQPTGGDWTLINLAETYVDPVVVMRIMSNNDSAPAHIRLRNVTPNSFEFQVEEWDYQDQAHGAEDLGYVVVERGTYELKNDVILEAELVDVNQSWKTVNYSLTYDEKPITLTQVQTNNDSSAVVTRQRNGSTSNFQVKLQEEENANQTHSFESVGYVAVVSGEGTNRAPVAIDQTLTTQEDTAVLVTLTATDLDQDPLTFSVTSGPTSGVLSGTEPNLTYTPNQGFSGTDQFQFVANDGTVDSNTATVTITVESVGWPSIVWTDAVGVNIDGNTVTKTAGHGWGTGGASSTLSIAGDGGVEFTATQTNVHRMLGLSSVNTDAHYNTIDYALYVHEGNGYGVWEAGVNKWNLAGYQIGDRFSVERVGTTVSYKKNDVVFYTSTQASTGSVIADAAIFHQNGSVAEGRILGAMPGAPGAISTLTASPGNGEIALSWSEPSNGGSPILRYEVQYGTVASGAFGSTFVDDANPGATITGLTNSTVYQFRVFAVNAYGSGPFSATVTETPQPIEDIQWTNLTGVSANGSTITKTANHGWGNAGASSLQSLPGDGTIEHTVNETNTHRMFGFSNIDQNSHYNTIGYALYIHEGNGFGVWENGVNRWNVAGYQSGDKFAIERQGNTVTYKKNGSIFYTSTVTSSGSLIADAAIYHNGGTIGNAKIIGNTN